MLIGTHCIAYAACLKEQIFLTEKMCRIVDVVADASFMTQTAESICKSVCNMFKISVLYKDVSVGSLPTYFGQLVDNGIAKFGFERIVKVCCPWQYFVFVARRQKYCSEMRLIAEHKRNRIAHIFTYRLFIRRICNIYKIGNGFFREHICIGLIIKPTDGGSCTNIDVPQITFTAVGAFLCVADKLIVF